MTRKWSMALLGILLTGCASNVHGDFACRAPNGTCEPLRSIDESAVREAGGTVANAASIDPAFQPRSAAPILAAYSESAPPERTGERVLRVVFPAQIDAQGIYHEPAAVHAVVSAPHWSDVPLAPKATAARKVVEPVQQASAAAARGSTLASMDEVIAARAARETASVQQYQSFSAPSPLGSVGGGVAESPGSVSVTPATSVAAVMANVLDAVPAQARPTVIKPKITGSTTADLNISSLRRTEADVRAATPVEMGSGAGEVGTGTTSLVPVVSGAPLTQRSADRQSQVQSYETLVTAGPGAQQ